MSLFAKTALIKCQEPHVCSQGPQKYQMVPAQGTMQPIHTAAAHTLNRWKSCIKNSRAKNSCQASRTHAPRTHAKHKECSLEYRYNVSVMFIYFFCLQYLRTMRSYLYVSLCAYICSCLQSLIFWLHPWSIPTLVEINNCETNVKHKTCLRDRKHWQAGSCTSKLKEGFSWNIIFGPMMFFTRFTFSTC